IHRARDGLGRGASARLAGALDGRRAPARGRHRRRRFAVCPAVPYLPFLVRRSPPVRPGSRGQRPPVRYRRVRTGGRRNRADADRSRAPVGAKSSRPAPARVHGACFSFSSEIAMREIVLALAIGALAGSGVWLILRPRTFQVIVGLSLLSYAVNLFILAMGRLRTGAPPILTARAIGDASKYADPLPQSLVLTAIVISFATMALFLVVLLA